MTFLLEQDTVKRSDDFEMAAFRCSVWWFDTVKRGNFNNMGNVDNKTCILILRPATPVKGDKTVNFNVAVYEYVAGVIKV